MLTAFRTTRRAVLAGLLTLTASAASAGAEPASVNDIARFLAGLPLSAGSPLEPLTRGPGWQRHAAQLDAAWKEIEQRQLGRIRVWAARYLPEPQPVLFYMFSGPDFLYANAFYPSASTYVLSGLEPVGNVPELMSLPHGSMLRGLNQIRESLATVLSFSFFITEDMKAKLNAGEFAGTLPILHVFLARAGKTIRETSFLRLDKEGVELPVSSRAAASGANGARITFSDGDGRTQTLYYFSTDLSDGGVRQSGFLKFCERLGTGDGLIKSASYLLHLGSFSKVREFLLANSATIVQDDSGIPIRYFAADRWALQVFGTYRAPISIFSQHRQEALAKLFRKGEATPIDFGIGYRWRPHEANLLLAVRRQARADNDRGWGIDPWKD
ncbi:MAG TPA: hypothetical protein VNK52_06465 [Hyphomicrobiaceae bacterium]|nr:hypothetical protein [Hyphomicrobiaceae bacterium]